MKPQGKELEYWCELWDGFDHQGKVDLCLAHEITYETGRHWRSDSRVPALERPTVEKREEQVSPFVLPSSPKVNTPMLLRTSGDMSTAAIVGDFHNPYQDPVAVEVMEKFLTDMQPDYLIYNGDVNDFYQVSVFAKDPARLGSLQSDIDVTTGMFERHDRLMPNTKKILIEGTHESRWFKYLQLHAPALANLNATDINELYQLDKYNIDFVPFERGILINGIFLVLHGDIVSAHSSYTAKRHYEKQGGNGICNHTHRGGSYYKRDRFGTWGWWENFCLCSLNPDWIQNPDWVQGFSLVHFNDKDRFWVEQIPIINGSFIYGGVVYS